MTERLSHKRDCLYKDKITCSNTHLFVLEKANYTYKHTVIWQAKQPTHPGKELWQEYIKKNNLTDCEYGEWAFGVEADLLAHLVAIGGKTATASAYPLYELENEPLPITGAYSVILDSKDNAVCIIHTKNAAVVPFNEVTAEHAYKEGEGDKSLDYWREVHEKFFTECLNDAGQKFTPDMKVVCEEFAVVYKK